MKLLNVRYAAVPEDVMRSLSLEEVQVSPTFGCHNVGDELSKQLWQRDRRLPLDLVHLRRLFFVINQYYQ
jgi:hypothetical protein